MENPMKEVRIEKIVINMGVGEAGEELKKGQKIIEKITGTKSIQTKCKIKQPLWGIRPGLPIGIKTTLRKEKAKEFLKTALKLSKKSTRIYYHGFGTKEKVLNEINNEIKSKVKNIQIRKAGDIGPYIFRWLVSFVVK